MLKSFFRRTLLFQVHRVGSSLYHSARDALDPLFKGSAQRLAWYECVRQFTFERSSVAR
jgi:hypothetical protein